VRFPEWQKQDQRYVGLVGLYQRARTLLDQRWPTRPDGPVQTCFHTCTTVTRTNRDAWRLMLRHCYGRIYCHWKDLPERPRGKPAEALGDGKKKPRPPLAFADELLFRGFPLIDGIEREF
jgi:hypothetical protein